VYFIIKEKDEKGYEEKVPVTIALAAKL